MMRSYVAVDLETTGCAGSRDWILEIGAIRIEEGEEADSFSNLLRVPVQIPPEIQELTGITPQMAAEGIDYQEGVKKLLDFCGDLPLVGHNVGFDYSFIRQAALNMGVDYAPLLMDTLQLARKLLPELPSKRLGSCCAYYGIDIAQAHRALDDAVAAAHLYEELARQFGPYHETLFEPRPKGVAMKRQSKITPAQLDRLVQLTELHGLEPLPLPQLLTKNEASRRIDQILHIYGRPEGK
ncbi:MAG: 3'-5' exonuclease [Lachnospiraceae bacterium]|nr:3'-5' exonuclease [Lachnospiraceae bacterium]MDY5742584.1 3'-5' exonuclease [Lachnospiraceae bacterium]